MSEKALNDSFFNIYSQIGNNAGTAFEDKEKALRGCEKLSKELKRHIDTMTHINSEKSAEKQLLEAEYYTWKLLAKFAKAELNRENHLRNQTNGAKNNFYSKFMDIHRQNRGSASLLAPLKLDTTYVPLSQYELVNDIISSNELLYYLNHIVDWLHITGNIDESNIVMPISLHKVQKEQDAKNTKISLDPDPIFNESSDLDDRTRYEHKKLMKSIFEHLRCGKIVEAYDLLVSCKQTWRAATLNGGLPFHDFYLADAEKPKMDKGDDFLREVEHHKKEATILDFMKNKEWLETLQKRSIAYGEQRRRENRIDDVFFETFGNANWILWLMNCWNLSLGDDIESYEKGVYAILSSNVDVLKHIFKEIQPKYWYNMFWTDLRGIVYLDVIKQYIRLFTFFKERIPQSEVNGEDLSGISSSVNSNFKKVLSEGGLLEDSLKHLINKLDAYDDLSSYNKLQLKLVESKISSILDNNTRQWDSTFRFIATLSNTSLNNPEGQSFIGHRLRFYAYFLKMVEKLGINTEALRESVDTTLDTYLKYLIRMNETNNAIYLYNEMNQTLLKVRGLAWYLVQIENSDLQKKYKEEMEQYVPELSKEIIREIFQINQTRSNLSPSEIQRRRFDSVKWLNINDEQMGDAIKECLHLLRLFLVEDNIETAIKLRTERTENIFNEVALRVQRVGQYPNYEVDVKEKIEHDRLFDAYRAYQVYSGQSLTNDLRVGAQSLNQSQAQLKGSKIDYVQEAIQKIKNCLFGSNQEKKHAIYDLKELFNNTWDQTGRASELRTIQKLWVPRLIGWYIEIIENNFRATESEILLQLISNPDFDCLNYLEENERNNIIKRIAALLIKDSGFIASLLIGNKYSAGDMETETWRGNTMM